MKCCIVQKTNNEMKNKLFCGETREIEKGISSVLYVQGKNIYIVDIGCASLTPRFFN